MVFLCSAVGEVGLLFSNSGHLRLSGNFIIGRLTPGNFNYAIYVTSAKGRAAARITYVNNLRLSRFTGRRYKFLYGVPNL